jgi:DNA-binding response OmpR family regulator
MFDKINVLVVEDHLEVLDTMVFLLKRAGCSVVSAQTGNQGMALAQDGNFDLITLDIDLPGISGFEICRRLKQDARLRQTPVIFVSGRACDEDLRLGFEMGAADYITKPFDALAFVPRLLSRLKPVQPLLPS